VLLEITSLVEPPAPEDLFAVTVVEHHSTEPVWTEQVRGADFRENYSLCLFLAAGVFQPGRYAIAVQAATGEQIFWSVLDVQ